MALEWGAEMVSSVWISSSSQYGALAPGESKTQQGALQRAVAQAIKRHLFEDADTYERVLRDFAGRLKPGLEVHHMELQAARHLWQALLADEDTALATVADPPENPVPDRLEALFGFALHGLCATLAGQWAGDPNRDPGDTDDTETLEDDDGEEAEMRPDAPLGVEHALAVGALVGQLRQITWKWRRDLPEDERPEAEDWRVVARVLLDTLLAALGDWFEVRTGDTRHCDGKPHTLKQIIIRQPALAQRIERLLHRLPMSFTPQPLRAPVAYRGDASAPTDDAAETAIRIDLIGYRQTNDFLRRVQRGLLHADHHPPAFGRYLEAVDLQQAVPWRVNRDLLHRTRALIDLVNAPPACDERMELSDWVRQTLYRPKEECPRHRFRSSRDRDGQRGRPGEHLDHPSVSRALDALCPTDPLADPAAFYLPWKADYRGRIYAQTAWLTPQGGDLQRALLEFARGQVLTEAGVGALRRHGANLVSRKRLLDDLRIIDRPVVTLDERERWVLEHEHAILASAADPLAEPFWRVVADEPMQFLAFCLAYRQWKDDPATLIHLPVQIDGTCNGIQHIAALTGDAGLAKAVNVLPRPDGLPGDIYSELAERARRTLGQAPVSKGQAVHRRGLELADAWLAADPARRAWLDRKTAKKVVMTIPYGASYGAQAQGVLEAVEERIVADWQRDPPPASELDALVEGIRQDKTRQRRGFVARCTRDRFDAVRRRAFADDDELVKTLARGEWERLRTFGAYVALALVEHLHGALDHDYPGVRRFADWLAQAAKACAGTDKAAGLPLLWLTPLGFPVVQSQFKSKGTSVTVRLGEETIKLDVRRLTDEVDPGKQRDALLPNLIHSLDATHLMLTLLDAKARGITDFGSVHDCLLVHPNQAESLARTVRATFAELYAPDEKSGWPKPLSDWLEWMNQVVALRGLTVQYSKLVKGAFEHPGKEGERRLDDDAESGKKDAVHAREALANLRGFDSSERFVLGLLLERIVQRDPPKIQPTLAPPPQSADLALTEAMISEYFFS
jgi:hypothetical protein